MGRINQARCRFPTVIIQHAIRLSFRPALSQSDIEDLCAERSIDTSCEPVRR